MAITALDQKGVFYNVEKESLAIEDNPDDLEFVEDERQRCSEQVEDH